MTQSPERTATQAAVRLDVLGPLRVSRRGVDVRVPPGRQRQLLCVLTTADGTVPAERLVDLMWGGEPGGDARAALHTTVARLRRTVGDDLVRRDHDGYVLARERVETDARQFRALVDAARRASDPDALALLDDAIALWRGEPWPELDGLFVPAESLELAELHLDAQEQRAVVLARTGRGQEAAQSLATVVDRHPLRERATEHLMRVLAEQGRVADALAAFERHRAHLADELGLDPSPLLTELHGAVLRREVAPRTAPAGRAPTSRPGELIGRASVTAAVVAMLDTPGLVTVVGPGGVGKTSLARQITRRESVAHWVDLGPVDSPADVLPTIARAVGVDREVDAKRDDPSVVAQHLGAGSLVVLDNCEHLVPVVAGLVERFLESAPATRWLATSRERIGVRGERVTPLAPLRTGAADSPAVTLFVRRAREAFPGLVLDDDALQVAQHICARLDGLPLAIELAASRAGALGLADIAARVDDRLALLRGGPRTAPARHRTIAATIAWSDELLEDDERSAFRRLSVMAGSFELAAAEEYLSARGTPDDEAADLVGRLVDRSMLARVSDDRYRMLTVLRTYAHGSMGAEAHGEARTTHARWCRQMSIDAQRGMLGPDEARWAHLVESRIKDFRAAVRWSIESGDAATASRIIGSLGRWAYFRMRHDVLVWADDLMALDHPAARAPHVHLAASSAALLSGRDDEAREHALHAIDTAADSPLSLAAAHSRLAAQVLVGGDPDGAVEQYRRALELTALAGSGSDQALAAGGVAIALARAGHDAREAAQTALALADGSTNPTARSFAMYAAGEIWAAHDPRRAISFLTSGLALARTVGNEHGVQIAEMAIDSIRSTEGSADRVAFERWLDDPVLDA